MTYTATVRADSCSPEGHRLTTLEVEIPRIVLAELNTHRAFSRNSASSRAIPVRKQILKVLENPFIPEEFGGHQPGMQSAAPVISEELGVRLWLQARDSAVINALRLLVGIDPRHDAMHLEEGAILYGENSEAALDALLLERPPVVHKELVNRLLEPFMWHTVLVSSTEWKNFFELRCHPDAQPQIRRAAEAMRQAMALSEPAEVDYGQWHLPFYSQEEREAPGDLKDALVTSVARCARVSYETHGQERGLEADRDLAWRLREGGHMSPFEHIATPGDSPYGNFTGWAQLRHSPMTLRSL